MIHLIDSMSGKLTTIVKNIEYKYFCLFIGSFLIFLYYLLYNPLYFWPHFIDMHYYTAVADSIFGGTGFYDIRQDPPWPITTTQHGITYVHLVLMKIGILDQEARLRAIMILNFTAFLASAFVIHRFFSFFQVKPSLIFLAVATFLFSNHIFKVAIAPINDGIFLLFSLILLYLILEHQRQEKSRMMTVILILVISLIMPHFRTQGVLIPLCAAVSYMVVRNWRMSFFYLITFCFSYLSVHVFYALCVNDLSGIHQFTQEVLSRSIKSNYSLQWILQSFTQSLPVLFWGFGTNAFAGYVWFTFPLFIALFIFLTIIFFRAIRDSQFEIIFLGLYIYANIFLLYISPVFSFRYILCTFPVIILFLVLHFQRFSVIKSILTGYLVYIIVLFGIEISYLDSVYRQNIVATKSAFARLPNPSVLVSASIGESYFLFKKRSCQNCPDLATAEDVLLFGPQEFLNIETSKLQALRKIEIISIFPESWIVNEFKGVRYQLVHLKMRRDQ